MLQAASVFSAVKHLDNHLTIYALSKVMCTISCIRLVVKFSITELRIDPGERIHKSINMMDVKYTKITCLVSISTKLHVFHKLHKHVGDINMCTQNPKYRLSYPGKTAKQLRGQITAIKKDLVEYSMSLTFSSGYSSQDAEIEKGPIFRV